MDDVHIDTDFPEEQLNRERLTPWRCAILVVPFAVVVPAIVVALMAAGLSLPGAGSIAVVAAGTAGYLLSPSLPLGPDDTSRRGRVLMLVWIGLGSLAVYRIACLSVYMHDVQRTEYAFDPTIRKLDDKEMTTPFFPQHNCFTCYIVGAHLAGERVDNLYDGKYYRRAKVKTPIHHQIGESLHVDTYQYPPPFLILPRALLASGGDFYQLRAYWFALNVTAIVATVIILLLWTGGPVFNARWLALPILLASPVMIGTLQIQNVHVLIILMAMLSLPAFEKRLPSVGGALLGFAVVSKLFPGLLLVFLLLQKRWRDLGWTLGWMIAFCVATVLWFGPNPFEAFLRYQMPRLASGEAFWFATIYISAMVKNGSVLGVAYKLKELGLLADPESVARIAVWAYTAVVAVVLLVVGRRRYAANESPSRDRLALTRIWLVLLILGQLRSPFLPWVYGNVPTLLLLLLLIPTQWKSPARLRAIVLLIPAWITLSVIIPLPFGGPTPTPDLIHTLAAFAVVITSCAVVIASGRVVAQPPSAVYSLPQPRAAGLHEQPTQNP